MPELNLPHRLRLPGGAANHAPAVVMVHGLYGDENSMWAFERTLPRGAVIVSPRAPLEAGSGYSWFAEDRSSRGGSSFDDGLEALREFVARLPEAYGVDGSRVVLVGFSQGAAMGYALALSQPAMVRGLAALAGFVPAPARQGITPGRLSGKPVFIAHGAEDPTLSIEEARQAREAMALAGAEITYGEYEVGHKLNMPGMRDLTAWLAKII